MERESSRMKELEWITMSLSEIFSLQPANALRTFEVFGK
jgi:hypothetical protein